MFNRSYQIRAVRAAGGGHQVADDALRLPWGGIFRSWRPLVHVALAADQAKVTRGKSAANGCKNRRQLLLFDGKLRGLQLELNFPPPAPEAAPPKLNDFPPLAAAILAPDMIEDELAAEFERLFPL